MPASGVRISRPSPGTSTGRVWEIAEEITRANGRRATRSEVIKRFQEEGGNYNTASTQYHHWKTRYDAKHAEAILPAASAQPLSVQVKEAGRIVLPAELRSALGIAEGDTLAAQIVDGEIRLTPLQTAIRRAQELVRKYVPADVSLVDQLIEERRREAASEGSA